MSRIFKLESIHEFNKPLITKVWTDEIFYTLNIDGVQMDSQKIERIDDKRYIIYFYENKNYKAQLKNSLIDFISVGCNFSPDYLVRANDIKLVDNSLGEQYIFDSSKITKTNYKKNSHRTFEFAFQASWNYLNEYDLTFSSDNNYIQTYNPDKLKSVLGVASNMNVNLYNVDLIHENRIYEIENNKLFEKYLVSINASCRGFFNLLMFQLLSFKFNMEEGAGRDLIKRIEHNFKIPNRPGLKNWEPDKSYAKFDMVLYEGNAYRANANSNSNTFDVQNWTALGAYKYYSFANERSFFDTEHGSNCWTILKSAMPYMVDKHLGDLISIKIVSSIRPNLNDWFEYETKKFRIIKVVEHKANYQSNYDFIEIFGCQLMELKENEISNDLNWVFPNWPTVQFQIKNYSNDDNLVGIEAFVPDDYHYAMEQTFNLTVQETI